MANAEEEGVFHEISGMSFSFFRPEEVRKLSVKKITSATAFDQMNHPVPGGVYDPALGPTEPRDYCPTCSLLQKDCPGHMGHIDLNVPVFNPFLFNELYKVRVR